MRSAEFRRFFLLTLSLPYIVLFFLSLYLFYSNYQKLRELQTVRELISPINDLSKLILYLNREKVYKTAEYLNLEENFFSDPREEILREMDLLKDKLFKNPHWVEYCNCWDLLKLDEKISNLLRERTEGPETLLRELNRYISLLNGYYVNLSSKLREDGIAEIFRSFYFLHRQHTVLSDYTVENLLFLKLSRNRLYYDYYYLRGLFSANLDAYFALLENPSFKELYKREVLNTELVKGFEKGFYKDETLLIVDYKNFSKRFWAYRCTVFKDAQRGINTRMARLQLELISLLAIAGVLGLFFILFHIRLYTLSVENINRLLSETKIRSSRDPLTGLLNRRLFNLFLWKNLKPLHEAGERVSLILLDLDNFKKINDTYGHQFGDKVLKTVARIIKENIRRDDVAFRWGGEEFAIFVRGDREAARKLAERIRKVIELTPVNGIKITASFGVAEYGGEHPRELFEKADRALYEAKRKGKNRVEVAD